ncbi:NYN domain-containing protein [Hyphomicrobium sp.]|uniref:NYN domain-containing protein n=1 Tax=Hyphomicrobium sp. TaxID=82 RepID=UPI002E374CEE|nr:NYN domain-containing protein [Hyphomicrobium sp.]HEX2841467.1 NYN domain-containing protein [Hyphomicrobium sp.]
MKVESTGTVLSTVFVDYDNIYLSLKRKNEEAAKRFAKDASLWLREIESGRLITPTNGVNFTTAPRRIVMSRCYGNPVPRRNAHDNSTDMNSFPFVRHHFLRAGFEVVDCPPLTAQLKNSADIRMVMDVRDVLHHDTRFDEFILLSGDADFTPVLHRLRAHARRTVVFANDHTAQPYTAISDGEVREADLISLLLDGRIDAEPKSGGALREPTAAELETIRKTIVAEVAGAVRSAGQPVPLEALADRAVRVLGHEKTVGSAWGGAGGFRELLAKALPKDIKLTDQAPYFAYEPTRQISREIDVRTELPAPRRADMGEARPEPRLDTPPSRRVETRADYERDSQPEVRFEPQRSERPQADQRAERLPARYDEPRYQLPREARSEFADPSREIARQERVPQSRSEPQSSYGQPPAYGQQTGYAQQSFGASPPRAPQQEAAVQPSSGSYGARPAPPSPEALGAQRPASPPVQPAQPQRSVDQASQIQQSIARIHEACQAPPLSPPEYRVLFEVMAEEITANNLSGQQTLINIVQRAREMGLEVRRDDVRFVLEVVSEADPWFEQGASANLFASRFRNFVVARCRSQGLNLSADEIDLIDAWFGGAPASQRAATSAPQAPARTAPPAPQGYTSAPAPQQGGDRWQVPDNRAAPQAPAPFGEAEEEFPRIVRSRLRG